MIPFIFTYKDPATGVVLIEELECEIEVECSERHGEIDYLVGEPLIGSRYVKDMAGPIAAELRTMIRQSAEDEIEWRGKLYDDMLEYHGIAFIKDHADPEGRYEWRD